MKSILEQVETIEVIPYQGIGRIKLGMTEAEVKNIIKNYYSNIRNPITNRVLVPYFNVEYNENQKAKYIELSRDEEIVTLYPALFKGLNVFTTKANDLIPEITKYYAYDSDNFELGYSYIFPKIDLAFWRPIIFEESDMHEDWFKNMCPENQQDDMKYMYFATVAVGIKGYYSTNKSEDIMDIGSNKLMNNCKVTLESYCELKDFKADGPSVEFRIKKR